MQHYRLGRDLEIGVLDGERRLGNGLCLPAGPLRERPGRLGRVDLIVANGTAKSGEHGMTLVPGDAVSLVDGAQRRALASFKEDTPIHAVAGIGNPERFFRMLEYAGLKLRRHPFPDHHVYEARDIVPPDHQPVLMTEKDAVKCTPFADTRHWYVAVEAEMEPAFAEELDNLLGDLTDG